MIWVAFAILTGVAILSVLWPLSRPARGLSRKEAEVGFYQAQLAEIDRDVTRGLTTPADAESARAQAGRRLIEAAQAGASAVRGSLLRRRAAAIVALVLIPAVALPVYLYLGEPDLPDAPLSARLTATPSQMDIGMAVARIEQHLAANPDDGRGWELLGPIDMRLGRADDAARAFANAIRTLGDSAEREQNLGAALLEANGGQINDRARAAFEAALRLDPKAPAPRFYLGVAAEQVGDKAQAAAQFSKLLASAPPDAPWASMVRMHLAALTGVAPEASTAGAVAPGPASKPAEAATIASLAPDQQQAMIKGMVAKLAARLAQTGGGVDDWERLVRAYSVLREPDKARAALSDARRNLSGDGAAQSSLSALAHELGLEG